MGLRYEFQMVSLKYQCKISASSMLKHASLPYRL